MKSEPIGKTALISAVIPVGGFPNGIEQLYEWTKADDLKKFELIFILDTTDQQVIEAVNELAKQLSTRATVKVGFSGTRTSGGSRNIGLEMASTEWVTFWDSDDIPLPNGFLNLMKEGVSRNSDLVVGGFSIKNQEEIGKLIENAVQFTVSEAGLVRNPALWRMLIRHNLASKFRFPNSSMGEDQVYLAHLLTTTQNITYSKLMVYEYWQYSSGQLTKSKIKLDDLIIAQAKLLEISQQATSNAILALAMKITFSGLIGAKLKTKITLINRLLLFIISKPRRVFKVISSIFLIIRNK